jgi:hypothetical protein
LPEFAATKDSPMRLPMIDVDCQTGETGARTNWLQGFVTCTEGDTACPS